jgi:UDP-GlcNAc:undecaprenyl-phosphate GlcNAc-1-phosphate transferase
MQSAFFSILTSATLAVVLLWSSPTLASQLGLIDVPGGRKDHEEPTPATGGLAIFLAMLVAALLFGPLDQAMQALLAAAALLVVVGIVDDRRDLRWFWRVPAQAVAALVLVYFGDVRVETLGALPGGEPILLGVWAVPFTVLASVGVINAINMCDGADGVAGALCLTSLALIAGVAVYAGNVTLFVQLVPLMAALLAFLAFNLRSPWRRRAGVFLGNSGSAMLGLALAWAAYRLTQSPAYPVAPALAPWLLAPPLIDCLVLTVRRLKLGRSPFQADQDHAHHLLLAAGFSPTQVALGLASATAVLGGIAATSVRGVGNATPVLVVAFGVLTLGYYFLTSRRVRAVRAFASLRSAADEEVSAEGADHAVHRTHRGTRLERVGSVLRPGTPRRARLPERHRR